MLTFSKKISFVFLLLLSHALFSQDTLKYRLTLIQGSVSQFFLLAPTYPQVPRIYPSGALSLKSFRTDSVYSPFRHFNFMITVGATASRYLLSDEVVFHNFLDKSPMPVFSKRFWGGFGLNYRKDISKRFILDVDVAPCVQMIVDKSEETRTDTSSWESKGFEDIYEGLHLYTNVKLELKSQGDFGVFFTVSGSVPLMNRFVDNGDDKYKNVFKGQLFLGIGLTHHYRSKRKVEKNEKPRMQF